MSIDGRFTFLNGPLARHYGIKGIDGEEFQRVDIARRRAGRDRDAGVDSDAVFVRDADLAGAARQMGIGELCWARRCRRRRRMFRRWKRRTSARPHRVRQRLEQHRANPACGACHNQMDPLGFSLENYDAAGRWRTRDGNFDVDSVGTLPDGKTIAGAKGLKEMLRSQAGLFTRNVAEKMLTFALGRGLEALGCGRGGRDQPAGGGRRVQVFESGSRRSSRAALSRCERERREERMNPSKRLSRRAMLQGMGAAIALPVLDAMTPAFAATAARADPHGISVRAERDRDGRMDAERAARRGRAAAGGAAADHEGAGAVSQRCHDAQRVDVERRPRAGRRSGDHGRAGAAYLTGVHPRKTYGKDIQTGISMDQVAAQKLEGADALRFDRAGLRRGRAGRQLRQRL